MRTITDLRKALKAIGFGVRTKTNSFGKSATYYHVETGRELKSNVFTAETLLFWKPLFDFRKDNADGLNIVRASEDDIIYGLK